jgi:hypothetical protein
MLSPTKILLADGGEVKSEQWVLHNLLFLLAGFFLPVQFHVFALIGFIVFEVVFFLSDPLHGIWAVPARRGHRLRL